ncbi:hypothetical protein UC8_31630 [Roseimaritima ulvae]|uniref:Uncharacterized protein n=1 Tax=Roseimaritima ulvae TaxID=980254 RepID=A0A5B9QQ91_9BACT|nr:hypothetical protein UC8_31630 [Roseimaritima ulvae]
MLLLHTARGTMLLLHTARGTMLRVDGGVVVHVVDGPVA